MSSPKSFYRATGASALAAALSLGMLIASPIASGAQELSPPNGHVVLIGGAISPGNEPSEKIIQRIVDLAEGHAVAGEKPRIAVITAASKVALDPVEAADGNVYNNATANGLYYQSWFEAHGAEVYLIPIDVNPGEDYPGDPYSADRAFDPMVAEEIRKSDAIYFGGGDQTNYVRSLFTCTAATQAEADVFAYTSCSDTPAMAAIREVVDSGGVTAGTSAGLTIQQGADMISGGEPYESWRDGAQPGWSEDGPELAYIPAGGLGFFTEGNLDSHFARRDRQPRVVRLALQTGHDWSFGVEEKTALVVDRQSRSGEVIGALGATLLDTSTATSDGRNAAGIRYSYFMAGSKIDFATGQITLNQTPHTGPGVGTAPAAEDDIWKSWECKSAPNIFGTLTLAQNFVRSSALRVSGDTCNAASELPRFRTTFNRDDQTRWTPDGSFVDVAMTISEIPSLVATANSHETSLLAGSSAQIAITVTNTGATALTNFLLDGVETDQSATVVQPGGQITLNATHTVLAGEHTFRTAVTASAVDTNGAPLYLESVTSPEAVLLTLTGVPAPSGGSEEGAVASDTPKAQQDAGSASKADRLSATGGALPVSVVGLGSALVACSVFLLAVARRRKRA